MSHVVSGMWMKGDLMVLYSVRFRECARSFAFGVFWKTRRKEAARRAGFVKHLFSVFFVHPRKVTCSSESGS